MSEVIDVEKDKAVADFKEKMAEYEKADNAVEESRVVLVKILEEREKSLNEDRKNIREYYNEY